MDNRVAVISIIVEREDAIEELNNLLHEARQYIIGRMGIPYRAKGISIISIAMKKAEMRLSSFINKCLPLIIFCTHVLHCGAKLASQRGGIGKLPCSRMCNAAMHDCIKLPQRANLLNQPVPHSDDASAQAKHA